MSHAKQPDRRLTLGLFAGLPSETYQATLWSGVADAARQRDVNLLCLAGGGLSPSSSGGPRNPQNTIYDLVNRENVDGLVILSGPVGHLATPEDVRSFCERYRPLPMVSVAMALEGIPSLLVDNEKGMGDAVAHLIEVHGCRRIAFVRGPEKHPEAEERYRAYAGVLAEHSIDVDPALIAPGEFSTLSGVEAINLFVDERKLSPGVDFEAVVGVDDYTAMGAIEALQARGVRVPDEVAVVGFDDVKEATFSTPPLTTVRQPMRELGRRAAEMVLSLAAGEPLPETMTLPTEMVVRQSCGCPAPQVVQAAVEPALATDKTLEEVLTLQREDLLSETARAVGATPGDAASAKTEELLNAFSAELAGEAPGEFLSTLEKLVNQSAATGGGVDLWQGALSALRRHTLPYLAERETLARAENLWQQARVTIGEMAQRRQGYQAWKEEEQATTMRLIGQEMITTFDIKELMDMVTAGLPQLGIRSCYLSTYEGQESPPEWSRLMLAHGEKGRIALEAEGRRFLSRQLVPGEMLPQDRQYSLLIHALNFRESQIGFVVFEADPGQGGICEALRGQLSSALRGALLLEERRQAEAALEKAYEEVEKRVEARTTELQQETAERERLQGEVIDAQRRALQELSTPIIPIMDRILVMPLVGSIDSMRARDITRSLLAGIRQHRAKVVILDVTGVPIVDSGVADHLNKTIQAAQLKGARTIVTGIADAVAETIVDLGIDWSGVDTMADLQTGLVSALSSLGIKLTR